MERSRDALKPVFGASAVVGKYHVDFMHPEADDDWAKAVTGRTDAPGLYIIHADTFGQRGTVKARLDLDADPWLVVIERLILYRWWCAWDDGWDGWRPRHCRRTGRRRRVERLDIERVDG